MARCRSPVLTAFALACMACAGCGSCADGPAPAGGGERVESSSISEGGRTPRPESVEVDAAETRARTVTVTGHDGEATHVALVVPAAALEPGARSSVVIALHGRGEALRPPERGCRGWVDDYALLGAYDAMARRRLDREDYRGFVSGERLAEANVLLSRGPLRPLVVVAPYVPDLMRERPGSAALESYGDWLAGPLLEAVRREVPTVSTRREDRGIDGVSLGGMVALEAGFAHPETFGRVGAIQPAITGRVEALARSAAVHRAPEHGVRIRLLSSDRDPFLGVTRRLAEALGAQGIATTLLEVPGPHDYAFNRGPGSLELLLFHGAASAE